MKNLDWGKLSFGYSKTDYNVRCYYKDGKWSAPEVSDSEMLNIHMASTCLHYARNGSGFLPSDSNPGFPF